MKKLKMVSGGSITLEEGCNKYLDNCRARNLREGTINHYRQTYVQFKKFFDMQMLVSDIDESVYQRYVVLLSGTLHNDVRKLHSKCKKERLRIACARGPGRGYSVVLLVCAREVELITIPNHKGSSCDRLTGEQ